ncbi:hypothetical protein RSAG8_09652, partial [Rhizoctonia solani AG-8 WAC10335]
MWIQWLCNLPDVSVGIISGILPPVPLAGLMMLLPIILRLLTRFEGVPGFTGLELSLMTRSCIFQVAASNYQSLPELIGRSSAPVPYRLHVFRKYSGVATPCVEPDEHTDDSGGKSARDLYLLLDLCDFTRLAGSAGGLLRIVPLALYYITLYILGSTSRSIYNIKHSLRNVAWGTLFPSMT